MCIHIKIHLSEFCYLHPVLSLIAFLVKKNVCQKFLTNIFSQINAMIDIPLPIPRKINAENNDIKNE